MARSERADVSAGRGSVRAAGAGCGFVRRNDGSTSRAAALVGAAAGAGARGEDAVVGGPDGGAVCVAPDVASRAVRAGGAAVCGGAAGAAARSGTGAARGGGAELCRLDGRVAGVPLGIASRAVRAGEGAVGGGAAGAEGCAGTGAARGGGAALCDGGVGVELAAGDGAPGVGRVGTAGFCAATRLVALVPTRARRAGGAGLAESESSDDASAASGAVFFAEGARRRTGAGVGLASGTLSSVGVVAGLRLRGIFGRSGSSMRRSLAASEHGEPCARLC